MTAHNVRIMYHGVYTNLLSGMSKQVLIRQSISNPANRNQIGTDYNRLF